MEEEKDEVVDEELQELRIRAKALGVNVEGMTREKIEEKINIMLKVRLEGLSRLEFDEQGKLLPSLENLRILQIEAEQPKHSIRRADVLEKLQGYRLLNNKLNTDNKRWTRYISTDDGMLRAGGFPIRNNPSEEFIVFKNVSKKFTFSVKRDNVILMEKLPKDSYLLLSDEVLGMISEFRDVRPDGDNFVAVPDDFSRVFSASTNTKLAEEIGVNRGALGKNFRTRKLKYKNYFIFKLGGADTQQLIQRVDGLSEEEKRGNRGIPDDLQEVIDTYYPI